MGAKFESDCIAILTCVAEHGYISLDHIAEETGVSVYEVRRYLLKDAWEKRPYEKMVEWREKNWPLYNKLVDDCVYLPETNEVRINLSKYEYLEKYALQHGFILSPIKTYPFVHIEERTGETMRSYYDYDDTVQNYGSWIPIKKFRRVPE